MLRKWNSARRPGSGSKRRACGAVRCQAHLGELACADGPLEAARNAVMHAVPTALNERIFDAALARSLGPRGFR